MIASGSMYRASGISFIGHGVGVLSNTHPSGRWQSVAAYGSYITAVINSEAAEAILAAFYFGLTNYPRNNQKPERFKQALR